MAITEDWGVTVRHESLLTTILLIFSSFRWHNFKCSKLKFPIKIPILVQYADKEITPMSKTKEKIPFAFVEIQIMNTTFYICIFGILELKYKYIWVFSTSWRLYHHWTLFYPICDLSMNALAISPQTITQLAFQCGGSRVVLALLQEEPQGLVQHRPGKPLGWHALG